MRVGETVKYMKYEWEVVMEDCGIKGNATGKHYMIVNSKGEIEVQEDDDTVGATGGVKSATQITCSKSPSYIISRIDNSTGWTISTSVTEDDIEPPFDEKNHSNILEYLAISLGLERIQNQNGYWSSPRTGEVYYETRLGLEKQIKRK